ncbi:F-box protein SKIP23-like [Actinidia eriantha]|uniref:F-box protein SKIP23-like n=1 Tax=Actinidia eriantha TaxID=165200 RepID=UPI00258F4F19|nr:F-box protein SKIP23-like [Actinidia eriantha]
MAVEWADLPPELLQTIAGKFTIHADYIRFRAVCVNWRSSSPTTPHHLPCQLPWLMLPHGPTTHHRGFFSLSADKVHFLRLPEASPRRRRCGSSHGWLAITDESPAIFLLNPLTRAKVLLPPLSSFSNVVAFNFYDVGREYTLRAPNGDTYTLNLKQMRDFFIKKVILSSSPSSDDNYIAFAILNQTGDLAFCKNGDQSWKFIEDAKSYCEDVIYCNGLFYAVNKLGEITVCDVHGPSPRVSLICTPPQIGGDMQYVVSSSVELLLITRYLDFEFVDYQFDNVYKTMEFRVYRLDLNGPKWERVMSLGDKMLFLGENSSLALSATDFPGCKGNCIYYTDDYSESNYDGIPGDNDLGVYDLEDGSIEPLPCYPRNSISQLRWPPPIWVTPNPY